jgi:hypothetical protein
VMLWFCLSVGGNLLDRHQWEKQPLLTLPRTCFRTAARQIPALTFRQSRSAARSTRTRTIRQFAEIAHQKRQRSHESPLRCICAECHSTCPQPGASHRAPLRL